MRPSAQTGIGDREALIVAQQYTRNRALVKSVRGKPEGSVESNHPTFSIATNAWKALSLFASLHRLIRQSPSAHRAGTKAG